MNERCLAEDRCAALTIDGPAITNQPLCHACVDKLQREYDELPAILEILPMFKGGLWGGSGEAKVSKGKGEAPSPLNVHALDVIDSVAEVLGDVGTLPIADLMRHPFGAGRCLRVGIVYAQADKVIGITHRWEQRFARCGNCGVRALGNLTGSDIIRCSNCGGTTTRGEYEKKCVVTPDD